MLINNEFLKAFSEVWERFGEFTDEGIEMVVSATNIVTNTISSGGKVANAAMQGNETPQVDEEGKQRGWFSRASSGLGWAMGYIFSPNVVNILLIVSTAVLVISNPIGWGFGAAAAAVTAIKIGYEFYSKAASRQERLDLDRELSILTAIDKTQGELQKKLSGIDGVDLKSKQLVRDPSHPDHHDHEEPKTGLARVGQIIGDLKPVIFIKEMSTTVFSMVVSALTLNIPSLVVSSLSFVMGVVGENVAERKEEKHTENLEERIAELRAKLGIAKGVDLELALARNNSALKALEGHSGEMDKANVNRLLDSATSLDKVALERDRLRDSGLPPKVSLGDCMYEVFVAGSSVQANNRMSDLTKSNTDAAVAHSLGGRVKIDSYAHEEAHHHTSAHEEAHHHTSAHEEAHHHTSALTIKREEGRLDLNPNPEKTLANASIPVTSVVNPMINIDRSAQSESHSAEPAPVAPIEITRDARPVVPEVAPMVVEVPRAIEPTRERDDSLVIESIPSPSGARRGTESEFNRIDAVTPMSLASSATSPSSPMMDASPRSFTPSPFSRLTNSNSFREIVLDLEGSASRVATNSPLTLDHAMTVMASRVGGISR